MGKKPKGRLDGEGSIYRSGNGWIAQISLKGRLIRRRAASEEQAVAKLTELRDRRNRQMVLTSRVLDLSDDLLTLLRTHWQNQEEEQIIALRKGMPSWNAGRRVFCNEAGREIAARNLLLHFEKVKQVAGLPDALVFHDLRHTAGSLMLARGHDILDVSKILGHANPGITLKIYAHSYTEKHRQATADLAAALLKEAQ